MRLVTFTSGGEARLGAIVGTRVLDLARLADRSGQGSLPSSMLGLIEAGRVAWMRADRLAAEVAQDAPPEVAHNLAEIRLLAPIPRPSKNVFCLGLNYRAHLAETSEGAAEDPKSPIFFTKAVTSIVGPQDPILFDETVTTKYDWEAELGVVIGVPGRRISEAQSMEHVFGYTCFNDVSARDLQRYHQQWFLGKSLDGTCPFGPAIVTADEISDPHALAIECRVNGVVKQRANTGDMIFRIPAIIASLSQGLTLEAGDLISTGTPSGVGYTRTPPEYLRPGDVVEVEVEGVGLLSNRVADIRER
ncbi:MAG: FAA hydrolase family protein [Chloroflexi bacterium]|nr:FAA hydrolase family protein [Chloroflexota bacterium]